MSKVTVKRSPVQLLPDPRRLVTKPYIPNDHAVIEGESRVRKVITRVLALTEEETTSTLADRRSAFSSRHPDLDQVFLRSFEEIVSHVASPHGDDCWSGPTSPTSTRLRVRPSPTHR